MKKVCFLLAACFMLHANGEVLAQSAGGIKGIVFDRDTVVEFAAVVLSMAEDSSQIAGMTAFDGRFEFAPLKAGRYLLQFSCLGYKGRMLEAVVDSGMVDLGKVRIEKDAQLLRTVTVQGKRPVFRQEKGQIVVNVNNTILSEAGSLVDVLKKSPGLMVDNQDRITVPGKGQPIIYIDGREVRTMDELDALQSTDIDKIEIERTASARYSAEGNAVVRIRTKRALADRLALSVYDQVQFGRKIGNTAGFQLDHKSGKWSNLLSYSFQNTNMSYPVSQKTVRYLAEDTLVKEMESRVKYYQETHSVFSGNEYAINERHSVGLQFSGVWNRDATALQNRSRVSQTALPERYWESAGNTMGNNSLYNANLNYQYRPDSLKTLSVIAGYAYQGSRSSQDVTELDLGDSSLLETRVGGRSDYSIYSAQADYAFNLFRFANMSVGAKYSQVVNDGLTEQWDRATGLQTYSLSTRIADKIAAGYFDISKSFGPVSLQAGLRYEYTSSRTEINAERIESLYHSLFPSFALDYSQGKYGVGLSYSRRISRPQFAAINPEKMYIDTYAYNMGNPALKPSFLNIVEIQATLGNFYLMAGYTHRRDAIRQVARMDEADPDVMVWTYENMEAMHDVYAGVLYSNTWKWYTGQYEAYMTKKFSRVPYLEGEIRRERPLFQVRVSNAFQIAKGLSLNCDFSYQSGGDEFALHFEPMYNLSAGLVWKALKGRLVISLMADNILGLADYNCFNSMYGNYYMLNKEDSDTRYIRVGIRYNFNNIQSGIRRKEATQEELERIY